MNVMSFTNQEFCVMVFYPFVLHIQSTYLVTNTLHSVMNSFSCFIGVKSCTSSWNMRKQRWKFDYLITIFQCSINFFGHLLYQMFSKSDENCRKCGVLHQWLEIQECRHLLGLTARMGLLFLYSYTLLQTPLTVLRHVLHCLLLGQKSDMWSVVTVT